MTKLRHIITLTAVLLGTLFAAARVDIPDSLRRELDRPGLTPQEGVWRFAGDGAVMVVTRGDAGDFRVIVLDSPDTRLAPGTVIGTVNTESALTSRWHVATDTDRDGRPCSVRSFTATVDEEHPGNLTLEPTARLTKLRLWVLWRFFVNVSVHSLENTRKLTAYRIYPPDPDNLLSPIIL